MDPELLQAVIDANINSKAYSPGTDILLSSKSKNEPGKESAFTQALRMYKAQKAAFKAAESSLFQLFKSNKTKGRIKRKQTLDFKQGFLQEAGK